MSTQLDQLATALAKAQSVMPNAVMNRVNPHFRSKYADLTSVLDAIRGPLSANGLAVTQTTHVTETGFVLRTTLMHTSGQSISGEYPLPTTGKPQEMGSALSYARRYSLAAVVCNASDEDDDGNAAMTGDAQPKENVREYQLHAKPKFDEPTPAPAKPEHQLMQGLLENVSQSGEWTQGFCNKKRVFTKDATLGEAMRYTENTEVILGLKPGKRPNEFSVQSVTPVQEAEEE